MKIDKKIINYILLNQKKIMIMSSAVALSLVIFFVFIYIPKRKEMRDIKTKYESLKEDIQRIERLAGGKTIDESLTVLDNELKKLKNKLPPVEEETLKALPECASRHGISIISLSPQDARKSPIQGNIPGNECMALTIAMDVKGTYKSLAEFIDELQTDFPTLIRVKNITMSKEKSEDVHNAALKANLNLTMYMLTESK